MAVTLSMQVTSLVQNSKYLTYPTINHEQIWNFSLILSIFDFKCKILNQKSTNNG